MPIFLSFSRRLMSSSIATLNAPTATVAADQHAALRSPSGARVGLTLNEGVHRGDVLQHLE